ncbi:MAG: molecular chaperone HtpG [Sandaracinaceae bacterium]|nr:molecular chaperone HtpG [Sandaracinaceae bacterium]
MTETHTPSVHVEEHRFEAEVDAVLRLVINSLYSNKEIFLRELISNASDALDKLRFRSLTEEGLVPEGTTLGIRIEPDAAKKTLTIADNGVGMTKDELQKNLGTIAKSGTREFLARLEAAQKSDVSQIGQFGVGFYSSFLVADRVEVVSRAAGTSDAWKWTSEGQGAFRLEPATRDEQGTSLTLHLKDAHLDYLRSWEIERLVREYSDYLTWPIELKAEREGAETGAVYKRVNKGTALWQRSPKDVTKEQYEELYKHLSHDWQPPLAYKHFKIEGTTEFSGIVFVPSRAPFDLFSPEAKHGLRLHVKRVFVMEDAEEVLPKWLRFVRGVVDSEDLPLNVSRELLQDSRLSKTIRQQVVKAVLDLLTELAKRKDGEGAEGGAQDGDDYKLFWKTFGPVLKEGLHFEPDQAKKILPLLRYETSTREGLSSLFDVKSRMKEGQKELYYALGESRAQLLGSPHIEGLQKRGIEVVLMTDAVDGWAVQGIEDVDGVKLIDATKASADVGAEEAADASKKESDEGKTKALRDRMRARLQDHVSEVRVSSRLTSSPACLVLPEGGLPPHLERLLRSTQPEAKPPKRILEINPDHPLITGLAALIDKLGAGHENGGAEARIDRYVDLVHAQALLAEGSPPENPAELAKSFAELLTESVARA